MKLSASEARNLLGRRRVARQAGNKATVHSIDKAISAAVTAGEWPQALTRNDSIPTPKSYPRPTPRARQIDWEKS